MFSVTPNPSGNAVLHWLVKRMDVEGENGNKGRLRHCYLALASRTRMPEGEKMGAVVV